MRSTLLLMVSGALLMCYVVIGLYFLKFRRRTRDRLFTWFALAFFLFATQRLLLTMAGEWLENVGWVYGLRLLGFVIILAAIVDKNRSATAA
jgi:hypothetical protein